MSKTLIVPSATAGVNTIVTDEDNDNRRGNRGDYGRRDNDFDEVILRESLADQRTRDRDNVESRSAICGVKTQGLEIEGRGNVAASANAAASVLTTEKTAAAGVLTTEKVAAALGVQSEKLGAAQILDSEKTAAAAALQRCEIAGRATIEAQRNAAALDVQASHFAAAAQLQAQMFATAQALAAAENTARVQASILATSCDIKEKMAECCCSIKTTIRDDGDKTRDRMNHLSNLDHAVQLVDSKNEASELKTQLLIEQKLNRHGHHSGS